MKGQLYKGKERVVYDTQKETKRAKIDWGNTKSSTVTWKDCEGEDWDLNSIYEKITNLTRTNDYNHKSNMGK